MFTPLGKIASVSLGYKSLQNDFFYLNKATIDTYGIEKAFLIPIFMRRDLDAHTYEQNPKPCLWLFACYEKKGDLKNTGAGRYIEAMADRSASDKKQAGKSQTIREALEAQGGAVWYFPKARPNKHNIFLRKAIGSMYAPYLFEKAVLVDQRFNNISPNEGIAWKELGAALTSSLFAYSLEINGSAALGGGALETPTTKLRDYPVLDIPSLSKSDRAKLVSLAESVWANEAPVDFGSSTLEVGPALKALDKWIISKSGKNVSVSQLYDDLRSACLARGIVADDKRKKTTKRKSDSIGHVADGIVRAVNPIIQSKSFPDDFVSGVKLDLPYTFDRSSLKRIEIRGLLDTFEIEVMTKTGTTAYEGSHVRPVAEAIVRALLWGRSQFSVSKDRKVMDAAVNEFISWVATIEKNIDKAISESSYGTGYEDELRREVYSRLGIHPMAGTKLLPSEIDL